MLNSKTINACVKSLDFKKLTNYLDSLTLTSELVLNIVELISKSDCIIFQRPSENEPKRDAFLSELDNYIRTKCGLAESNLLKDLISLISSLEKGYRSILEFESGLSSMSQTSFRRVGLAFGLLANVHDRIRKDMVRHFCNLDYFDPKAPIKDSEGNLYYPNDLYAGLSLSCGRLIAMEAYRAKWISENKVVVLPESDIDMQIPLDGGGIFANLQLAAMWGRWNKIDHRVRYLGCKLEVYTDQMPKWVPQDVRTYSAVLFHFHPNPDTEILPLLAEFRFDEMNSQNFSRLVTARRRSRMHNSAEDLLAKELIALEILNAIGTLEQSLSLPLEKCKVLDLTIEDLLYGYATLKRLANEGVGNASIFLTYTHNKLLDELLLGGLSSEAAKAFLPIATFKSNSRDLYDCPLLMRADGSYYLFGFSMIHADLARVVLSVISHLKIELLEKGDAFESEILSFVESQGFAAKKIKVRRGCPAEVYDYDVAFAWGDYAFFVECKNRLLPAGSAISSRNFQNDLQDHADQVNRLAQGLIDYPDILEKEFPQAVGKKKIFCVLNALPFSTATSAHEIYFIDASMLKRFFESRTLNQIVVSNAQQNDASLERNPFVAIWKGDRPTPEDFLRYLTFPPQLAFAAAHYELKSELQQLGHRIFLRIDDYRRVHATPKMISDQLAKHGW